MSIPNLTNVALPELTGRAFDPKWSLDKAHAIDELARRALDDPALLDAACEAIGRERTLGFRTGSPLGWLGALRLFESGRSGIIARLLREVDGWTAVDQKDLIRLFSGPGKLGELTTRLSAEHDWRPKYDTAATAVKPSTSADVNPSTPAER